MDKTTGSKKRKSDIEIVANHEHKTLTGTSIRQMMFEKDGEKGVGNMKISDPPKTSKNPIQQVQLFRQRLSRENRWRSEKEVREDGESYVLEYVSSWPLRMSSTNKFRSIFVRFDVP
jgi:hypothetical protein